MTKQPSHPYEAEYYPIKRKGQRRRLAPNWPAIGWLEKETRNDARIAWDVPAGENIPGTVTPEFRIQRAVGWDEAKRRGMYPRPMFQTFLLETSSTMQIRYLGCPDCDDFSRTSQCAQHHDRDGVAGLKMGPERRSRLFPPPPQPPAPLPPAIDAIRRQYDQAMAELNAPRSLAHPGCNCWVCRRLRPAAVPLPVSPVPPADGTLAWRLTTPYPLSQAEAEDHGYTAITPDPARPSYLEINGETVQSSARLVRIEVERDGDTPA